MKRRCKRGVLYTTPGDVPLTYNQSLLTSTQPHLSIAVDVTTTCFVFQRVERFGCRRSPPLVDILSITKSTWGESIRITPTQP